MGNNYKQTQVTEVSKWWNLDRNDKKWGIDYENMFNHGSLYLVSRKKSSEYAIICFRVKVYADLTIIMVHIAFILIDITYHNLHHYRTTCGLLLMINFALYTYLHKSYYRQPQNYGIHIFKGFLCMYRNFYARCLI